MVTKKLSHEISGTENRVFGALSNLKENFLRPSLRRLTGTVSERFRNIDVNDRETTEYHYQNDAHSKVQFSACWTSTSVDTDRK